MITKALYFEYKNDDSIAKKVFEELSKTLSNISIESDKYAIRPFSEYMIIKTEDKTYVKISISSYIANHQVKYDRKKMEIDKMIRETLVLGGKE